MFADVAVFDQEASSPAQVRHLIDRCVRVAKASNGPSVLTLLVLPALYILFRKDSEPARANKSSSAEFN
jgi:hypothetical protein